MHGETTRVLEQQLVEEWSSSLCRSTQDVDQISESSPQSGNTKEA